MFVDWTLAVREGAIANVADAFYHWFPGIPDDLAHAAAVEFADLPTELELEERIEAATSVIADSEWFLRRSIGALNN